MAMQILVGDSSGKAIAELEPQVGPISWRLNDIGSASFTLATNDAKATGANLAFGNRIYITFDNGLPAWGGMIDTPRDWQGGFVTVNAYSAEYILGTRQTDRGRYFSGASVGQIYEDLINEANAYSNTGITIGDVYNGGVGHYPDYHYDNLLKIIRDSLCSTLSTFDFYIEPSYTAGTISFTAHLYEVRGSDKSGSVVLMDGHNLVDPRLTEQGEIVNAWDLAGAGNGWSADSRPYSSSNDPASISAYGYRQGNQIFTDVSVQETLDEHAATLLSVYKDPHNMIDLGAVNLAPAAFASYDVGDVVGVRLIQCGFGGFSGSVRVWGREFDPASGVCRLVVREEMN